jgi:hypothetical protein
MQFSPFSRHLILLRSKYPPQHPVLNTLSLCSSLNVRDQVSHPYRTTGSVKYFIELENKMSSTSLIEQKHPLISTQFPIPYSLSLTLGVTRDKHTLQWFHIISIQIILIPKRKPMPFIAEHSSELNKVCISWTAKLVITELVMHLKYAVLKDAL